MSNSTNTPSILPNNNATSNTATTVVSGIVIVLAVVFVALRFYVRIFTRAGLKWDDWLILFAVVSTVLTAVLLLWGDAIDPNGLAASENTNPDYIYTDADVLFMQLSFVSSIIYFQLASATKLAILLMYNRIFSVNLSFKYSMYGVGLLVIAWWIGCTVATLTNCIPLSYAWTSSLANPVNCFNYNVFWMAAGVCEILIDLIILALPVRVVLTLQLTGRKRTTVICIFLLGGFVIITDFIKAIFGYVPGGWVPSFSNAEVWTTLHCAIAIICACLPIMMPLIIKVRNATPVTKIRATAFSSFLNRKSRSTPGWSLRSRGGSGNSGTRNPGHTRGPSSEPLDGDVNDAELGNRGPPQAEAQFNESTEEILLQEPAKVKE